MTSKLLEKLRKSKKYRDLFVEGQIRTGIPFQIRVMRESRPWKQSELGDRANMPQTVISRMEKPGSGNLTIKTLLRLASAFDVGLIVRFAPFSEIVDWANGQSHIVPGLSQNYLSVLNFDEDEGFTESPNSTTAIPGELDSITRRGESDCKREIRLVHSTDSIRPQGVFPSYRPHEIPKSTADQHDLDAISKCWTDHSATSRVVQYAR